MAVAHADTRRYLDPAVLAKIGALDLRARRLVEGFISGMHRSPFHGFSIEFAEHRKYAQGDDLRHLDWKVYGRTDKHYVKQYEQETNLHLLLAVDCSASMTYRSAGAPMSKRDYATTLAAAIAYLALHQSDAVGLATFDSRLHKTHRASNTPTHWRTIVTELEHASGAGATAFGPVMNALADSLHSRHMVVIVSDLFADARTILAGVKHLRHRGHEPIVLHVLDPAERTFPFDGATEFDGLEDHDRIRAEPGAVRRRYVELVRQWVADIRSGCLGEHVDYELVDTGEAPAAALGTYLANRARRIGGK